MPPPPPPPPPYPPTSNPHVLEANGQYQNKPVDNQIIIYLNVVNTLTQLLLGAVVFSALSLANMFEVGTAFTQHIYLTVIGYIVLMSQAILTFNDHAGWAAQLKYSHRKLIHAGMQIIGAILAIAGSIISIINVEEHFQSAHAVCGMIALVLTFLSLIGGIINFLIPNQNHAVFLKTLHSAVGCLTITIAFIALCIAINNWHKYAFRSINADLTISFAVFALLGILISAFSRPIERMLRK